MPAIKCPNGKWKWGENGPCTFDSEEEANKIGHMIEQGKYAEGIQYFNSKIEEIKKGKK